MSDPQSLVVDRLVNATLGSNTYLVTRPGCVGSIIIDPGPDCGAWVSAWTASRSSPLQYALLTHEHYDHVGGLSVVRARWTCRVLCSRACSAGIADPARNLSRYLVKRDVSYARADIHWEDISWRLRWHGSCLKIMKTPGHSPGSTCVAIGGALFTGDLLLPSGTRVACLPGGDRDRLERSLAMVFGRYGAETHVYPGHGDPLSLGDARLARYPLAWPDALATC